MSHTTLYERIRNERLLVRECLRYGPDRPPYRTHLQHAYELLTAATVEAELFEEERDDYWRKKKANA